MYEETIRVKEFETSYRILTATLRGDCAVSRDLFAFHRGAKFPKDGVNVSLVNSRHHFSILSALRAAATP